MLFGPSLPQHSSSSLDLVKGHHGRGVVLIVVVLHCLSDAGLDESSIGAPLWK